MKIKTIEELTAPGDFVRRFVPGGFSTTHQMTLESSLEYIQVMIADRDLAPEIPEHVHRHYDRCRMIHTYGFFQEAYEFFTVSAQLVFFTLEAALGAAFMRDFPPGVPLVQSRKGKNKGERFTTPTYWTFADIFERLNEGWRIEGDPKLESKEFHWQQFNGSMNSLLRWARAKGLFYGERNAEIEEAVLKLRHLGAHPHSVPILTPVDSARAIRDVAELINHLWGYSTPGGRLYGQQQHDQVFLVRWTGGGFDKLLTVDQFGELTPQDRDRPEYKWRIIKADHAGDVYWFMINQASADANPPEAEGRFPVEVIGDYSTWEEAARELAKREGA
jgi:hypothetical protein